MQDQAYEENDINLLACFDPLLVMVQSQNWQRK